MTPLVWAILGASVAGLGGFGAGVALRVRRGAYRPRITLKGKRPAWLTAPDKTYHPKLPKFSMTPATRLEAVLTSWAALVDATHATWGATSWWGLVQYQDAMAGGRLLWNVGDTFLPNYGAAGDENTCKNFRSATTAKARWDAGQRDAIIAQANALLKIAVETAARSEEDTGRAITTTAGDEVSLLDVAEQYATDAAVSYLASTIPGAGAVLGLASALEEATGLTIGWTSGTGRQEIHRQDVIPGEIACRDIAVARVKDLIAHAKRKG